MSLGMELGPGLRLSTGDFVLDGDPAPKKRGQSPTNFRSMFIMDKTAGRIKMALGI